MSVAIPDGLQQFARELAELARKHDLRTIEGSFTPGMDHAWNERVTFTWKAGRHGEDGYSIQLSSMHIAHVRASVSEGEKHA